MRSTKPYCKQSKTWQLEETQIAYTQLREFEDKIGGNVKVGTYNMDQICPILEGQCLKIRLEAEDLPRTFLLGETTFTKLTTTRNYLLSEIVDDVKNLARVKYWIDKKLDLRVSDVWSPIFVSQSLDSRIVTIDGNHRLMAHYYQHRDIEGLHGYLFTHPNMPKWGFMPDEARKS